MTDERTLCVTVDVVFIPIKEWQFATYQSQKESRDEQSNQSSSPMKKKPERDKASDQNGTNKS